jgi:hypothetical protein
MRFAGSAGRAQSLSATVLPDRIDARLMHYFPVGFSEAERSMASAALLSKE